MIKIKVIHFMRRPRPGFNFSIEQIFANLRRLLSNDVDFSVCYSGKYNDGYFSKFYNILQAAFRQKNKAVAHITGETHFLNMLMRRRNVLLTIHDCRFMERKKGIEKKIMGWLYLKAPVKNAAFITVVSEATKKDVIRYTGCMPGKITVIPVTVNNIFKAYPKTFNKTCPVILQVGTGENKNLHRLIEVVKDIPCKLVIIGELKENIAEALKINNIEYTNKYDLSTEGLLKEYIDCDIVAFVSTFEGFGMPIIEANAVGRVLITSNISSMPEIAGDAACLVDPYNIEDMRNGLLKIISDDAYRETLINNGKKNSLRFNEQTVARSYYHLYKKIASTF